MDGRARVSRPRFIGHIIDHKIAVEIGETKHDPILARDLPTGRKRGGLARDVRGKL